MAGVGRIELPLPEPKSGALPLGYTPMELVDGLEPPTC